jgi:hypothetical protein
LFAGIARAQGWLVQALDRAALPGGLAAPSPGRPVLLCTRNDDLDGLIPLVHPQNRGDLVFVQNGMLRPWLVERGLAGATQGLLYVAVQRVGAAPVPGGESLFWGPHAASMAGLLRAGGIAARAEADEAAFLRAVAYKFTWNAVFGLLGERLGSPVGQLADQRGEEVGALCAELAPVLARALGVPLDAQDLTRASLSYAREIADYRGGLKEWRWRNGWLMDEAARQGARLPEHARWLAMKEP